MSEKIMEEDEYESLPPTSTLSTHLLAGAAAGIMEHSIMYPVDCVKTRMQSLVPDPKASYRNVLDALYRIVRYEGVRNTVRGINAVVYGAGPAHAMYFACYEKIKKVLSQKDSTNRIAQGTAGAFATLFHDAVMNPAEVVKQRMQVYNSPYRSCLHCMTSVYQTEGMKAFYRSFVTQLTMNIPFQCLHFVTYEWCQDRLNPQRGYQPMSHVIAGGMAGAVASAATTPLDVCKTLLNTQERCAVTGVTAVNTLPQAIRTIYKFRGSRGFLQGLQARMIFQMPSTAISWSVYEFFKYFIAMRQQASCDSGYTATSSVQVHAVSSD